MIQKPVQLLLPLLALFIAACGEEKRETPRPFEKALLMRETPENDSLVYNFGAAMVEALYKEDADTFNLMFHWDRFMDLALDLPPEQQELSGYRDHFKKGLTDKLKAFPQQLIQAMENGGYYDFLYFYFDESLRTYRLMCRLYSDAGINYHDYILRKSESRLYMEDVYVYTNGETLSTSTRNLFLSSLPPNMLERMLNPVELKDTRRMLEAMNAYENGSVGHAYYKLSVLEGPMRNLKSIHALRIHMAAQLDEETYMEAMETMMEDLPDDPTTALVTLDYYVIKEEFENALRILDLLEAETGDTFLNLMRGNVHYQAGEYETAIGLFEKLIGEYPDFLEGRLSLMSALAMKGDYGDLIDQLNTLNLDYEISADELLTYIESEEAGQANPYAAFMESVRYRTWKTRHL